MIINWIVRLVVVAVLWLLSFHMTSAQSEEMLYVVSGSTSINARQCPRLDCAVVEALQPGTEVTVIEMVNGDTVFGSDQWAQLENGSGEVYVHSALIDPVAAGESDAGGKVVSDMDQRDESAAPAREAESRETVEAAPLDTSRWLVVEVDRFTVRMPPMWEDIQELVADVDDRGDQQWWRGSFRRCAHAPGRTGDAGRRQVP
ncbi:MAG: SH3 domain-containing protein [Chloroflexi bacterium]|nr:SH3 domain-containing protein [Chloroflexota bacterium]